MVGKRRIVAVTGDQQPKIRKYCKAEEDAAIDKESPFTWDFYETEDTYIIDEYTRARLVWNDYHEVDMLHFARKTRNGKLKHVSLTAYEACSFQDFLTEILEQIQAVKDLGKPGQQLIPFFNGKEQDRAYEHEKVSWESFWKSPDLVLPSIRVRVGLNRKTGMYMLFVNSPVSTKLSLEYHNWQGPQLIFKLTSMMTMLEFIKMSVNDTNSEETV